MDGTALPVSTPAAAKLVKRNFLEALKSNDFGKLKAILIQRQIDVDTVFEVEDQNMVLASYKQGKHYRCSWYLVKDLGVIGKIDRRWSFLMHSVSHPLSINDSVVSLSIYLKNISNLIFSFSLT